MPWLIEYYAWVLLISAVLGFIGRNRSIGFFGWFLISLVFSPLLAGLGLMFTSKAVKW